MNNNQGKSGQSNIQKNKHKKDKSSISCFSCCSSNPKEPKNAKNQNGGQPLPNKDGTGPKIHRMNAGGKRNQSNDSEFLDDDPALGGEELAAGQKNIAQKMQKSKSLIETAQNKKSDPLAKIIEQQLGLQQDIGRSQS